MLQSLTVRSRPFPLRHHVSYRPSSAVFADFRMRSLFEARPVRFVETKPQLTWLFPLLIAGFATRLTLWWAFPSVLYPDEVFQYAELAHREVFGNGIAPWEHRAGSRLWVVPGVLAGVMVTTDWLGLTEPWHYNLAIAAVLSAMSLSVVVVGYLWAWRYFGLVGAVVTGALCTFWFELVYIGPKVLTGPIAANVMVVALYLAYPGQVVCNQRRLFVAGLLLGLVVAIRFQLAPAAFVAAACACGTDIRNKWLPLAFGGIVTLLMAGFLDAVTWNYPFQSFVETFRINIVEGRSHIYGIRPWYYYIGKWTVIWGGAVVPMLVLFLIGARHNLMLAFVSIAIVATHMLFAHKQYRFGLPAVPLIIVLIGLGTTALLKDQQGRLASRRVWRGAVALVIFGWMVTSLSLAIGDHFRRFWTDRDGGLLVMQQAYAASDMCGLGLVGVPWTDTGGYTHMHRDVPLFVPDSGDVGLEAGYNYAAAPRSTIPDDSRYARVGCYGTNEICLFRREGGCKSMPDNEVNAVLIRRNE